MVPTYVSKLTIINFSAYNYDSRNYDDEYDDYAPKSNYQPYGGGSGKKLNSYMKFLNTR